MNYSILFYIINKNTTLDRIIIFNCIITYFLIISKHNLCRIYSNYYLIYTQITQSLFKFIVILTNVNKIVKGGLDYERKAGRETAGYPRII